jgi:hypothetical protein
MNKNKNMKSSKKEENVKVRRVRQVNETNETNTNKKNKKEKPSVVSRSEMMRDIMSYTDSIDSFSANIMTVTQDTTQTESGGIHNVVEKIDLSSYPEFFTVTPYNEHVYAIKIIKQFEYEHPIELTYKEILAFQSGDNDGDSTEFIANNSFFESKKKYINDIANNEPWSVWYGASKESPEEITLWWDGIFDNFDKKVSKADGSLFTWRGKIVVRIETNWNITLSFRTEDGWLPDNKQWIYGHLSMYRRELSLMYKYNNRYSSYAPPEVDGLANETVYNDEYNDQLRVIRRIPRVYSFKISVNTAETPGKTGEVGANTTDGIYWYGRGLPYYYGPVSKTSDYNYCTYLNGVGTNENCLQGMARYIYISAKTDYDNDTLYVSKSGAANSIVDFNTHIVGYYDGKKRNDQDIKVKMSFNYLPKKTGSLEEPKIIVCDPYTFNIDDNPVNRRYTVYYPPKQLEYGVERFFSRNNSTFEYFEYNCNLNDLLQNDTNPSAMGNSKNFMSIISDSNGPIRFELTNVTDTSKIQTQSFFFLKQTVTIENDVNGYPFLSIKSPVRQGYLSEGDISGTFTLKITQGKTSTYTEKVINVNFKWYFINNFISFGSSGQGIVFTRIQ